MKMTTRNDPEVMPRVSHREGPIARTIEQQTAKLPSDLFMWGGLAALGASMVLGMKRSNGSNGLATTVGLLAPTLLIMGLYNKFVKLEGSDGA